jgi:hypothetical protein
MSSAAHELRQLATDEPDAFKAVAEKAQEPLRGRLLAILDENGG